MVREPHEDGGKMESYSFDYLVVLTSLLKLKSCDINVEMLREDDFRCTYSIETKLEGEVAKLLLSVSRRDLRFRNWFRNPQGVKDRYALSERILLEHEDCASAPSLLDEEGAIKLRLLESALDTQEDVLEVLSTEELSDRYRVHFRLGGCSKVLQSEIQIRDDTDNIYYSAKLIREGYRIGHIKGTKRFVFVSAAGQEYTVEDECTCSEYEIYRTCKHIKCAKSYIQRSSNPLRESVQLLKPGSIPRACIN